MWLTTKRVKIIYWQRINAQWKYEVVNHKLTKIIAADMNYPRRVQQMNKQSNKSNVSPLNFWCFNCPFSRNFATHQTDQRKIWEGLGPRADPCLVHKGANTKAPTERFEKDSAQVLIYIWYTIHQATFFLAKRLTSSDTRRVLALFRFSSARQPHSSRVPDMDWLHRTAVLIGIKKCYFIQ